MLFAQCAGDIVATDIRQADIEQDKVRIDLARRGQSISTAMDRVRFVPEQADQQR